MTVHTKDFQEQLFLENKSRIKKEDDESVPNFYNGYFAVWIAMLSVSIAMIIYFKSKKWF